MVTNYLYRVQVFDGIQWVELPPKHNDYPFTDQRRAREYMDFMSTQIIPISCWRVIGSDGYPWFHKFMWAMSRNY